jgi:hypothetical protein
MTGRSGYCRSERRIPSFAHGDFSPESAGDQPQIDRTAQARRNPPGSFFAFQFFCSLHSNHSDFPVATLRLGSERPKTGVVE